MGNCLFNAISWSVCGDQKFQSEIRKTICNFTESNWNEVGRLSGAIYDYGTGQEYIEKSKMRMNRVWGGSIELCSLSILTGLDVVVYFKGGYHKFGKNQSEQCFFLYNSGHHYEVILQP